MGTCAFSITLPSLKRAQRNYLCYHIGKHMTKFIELTTSDDNETKTELVNIASIGRVYPSPQSRVKTIVELNYQSINDAPVYLEVESTYENVRSALLKLS